MGIVSLVAELAFDEIEHRSFASRTGYDDNARIPAFQRVVSEKFEVASSHKIEFFLEFKS